MILYIYNSSWGDGRFWILSRAKVCLLQTLIWGCILFGWISRINTQIRTRCWSCKPNLCRSLELLLAFSIFSRLLSYCTRFGGWENCSKENVPRRIYTVWSHFMVHTSMLHSINKVSKHASHPDHHFCLNEEDK